MCQTCWFESDIQCSGNVLVPLARKRAITYLELTHEDAQIGLVIVSHRMQFLTFFGLLPIIMALFCAANWREALKLSTSDSIPTSKKSQEGDERGRGGTDQERCGGRERGAFLAPLCSFSLREYLSDLLINSGVKKITSFSTWRNPSDKIPNIIHNII